MIKVKEECSRMLTCSEQCFLLHCFEWWLRENDVAMRTTKNVLLRELDGFNSSVDMWYKKEEVLMNTPDLLNKYVDNVMVDMISAGREQFYDRVRNIILEWPIERISISKFAKRLNELEEQSYKDMIGGISSDRHERI